MPGFKHLIQCHCILPQYRRMDSPIFHKFVVFSQVDENDDVIQKIVKCNNCSMAHKIVDFCKSEIVMGGEDINTISINDIKISLPSNISLILENHKCDIATWEQVKDIIDNNLWGSMVNLSSQKIQGVTHVKSLILKSFDEFKIESNMRQDDLARS